jgi:hypothetical protein
MARMQSLPPGVLGAIRQRGLKQLSIGIDLGAAPVKAALRDGKGTFVWRERVATGVPAGDPWPVVSPHCQASGALIRCG